jgi:hypothetical protein
MQVLQAAAILHSNNTVVFYCCLQLSTAAPAPKTPPTLSILVKSTAEWPGCGGNTVLHKEIEEAVAAALKGV